MGLIGETIKITLAPINYQHFIDKGYNVPMVYSNRKKKMVFKRHAEIEVKTSDLLENSKIMVPISCDCCGKIYKLTYQEYIKNTRKYNGNIFCRDCIYKQYRSGENHFRWNNSLSNEERIFKRHYKEYIEFINTVISRDNSICQYCRLKTKNPEVHHLDGYNWCVDKRTDVTNGVTLCNSCHTMFHKLYGNTHNTKNQFMEWIGDKDINLHNYSIDNIRYNKLIYCFEENKIYHSAREYCKKYPNADHTKLYLVCNHKPKRHTFKNKHFFWVLEIISITNEEVTSYLNAKIRGNTERLEFTDFHRKYITDYLVEYNKYFNQ